MTCLVLTLMLAAPAPVAPVTPVPQAIAPQAAPPTAVDDEAPAMDGMAGPQPGIASPVESAPAADPANPESGAGQGDPSEAFPSENDELDEDEPAPWTGPAPLPAPPPSEPPQQVRRGAWAGTGWFSLGGQLVVTPLEGSSHVLAGGMDVGAGLRPLPAVGLFTQLAIWANSLDHRDGIDPYGEPVVLQEQGRAVAWDVLNLRLFVPRNGRVEPRFDLGGGFVVETRSFEQKRRNWGTMRLGAGLDIWLRPGLSLGLGLAYRLMARHNAADHSLAGTLALQVAF